MMASLLFCLVMFFSMHPSNSRPLGLIGNIETDDKLLSFSRKDVKSSSGDEMIKAQENLWAKMDKSNNIHHQSLSVANAMLEPGHSRAPGMEDKQEKGIKVIKTYFQQAFQETESERWKRQERSIMQSMPHNAGETHVDPNENDLPEDVVVMDYAQPHRKPPIHNKQP